MKWSKHAHANFGRKCENKKSFKSHKKANLIVQSNNYKQSISLAMLSNASDPWHRLVHQRTILKAKTAHSEARNTEALNMFRLSHENISKPT